MPAPAPTLCLKSVPCQYQCRRMAKVHTTDAAMQWVWVQFPERTVDQAIHPSGKIQLAAISTQLVTYAVQDTRRPQSRVTHL